MKLLSLYFAPEGTSGIRQEVKTLVLKKDYGIIGDKFANKEIDRSVMIVGTKPYNMAKDNSINLPKVALGENILLDFDPHILESGTRLHIGDAILEITKPCTLCKHLTKYSPKLPKLILNHRGVYCKVVKSGKISIGNNVTIEKIKETA